MAGTGKRRRNRGAGKGPNPRVTMALLVVVGLVVFGLAAWACHRSWALLRPEDLVPVLLAVTAVMAGLPALFGRAGEGESRHLDLRRGLAAQLVGVLLLLLGVAYGLRLLLPERLDAKRRMAETVKRALAGDPLALEIQKAYARAATGTAGETWQSPELGEAIDSARHFVHGWLSGDREHAATFCLEELRPALRRATLPRRLIERPAEVPLTDLKVEEHVYDGKTMRLKMRYGSWAGEILLRRDFGWQVAALPTS